MEEEWIEPHAKVDHRSEDAVATAREWVAVLDPTRNRYYSRNPDPELNPTQNRHYYWNPATSETTWTLPPDGVLRPQ